MNTLLACRLGFNASTFHPPQHKQLMKKETRESTPPCRKHPGLHILHRVGQSDAHAKTRYTMGHQSHGQDAFAMTATDMLRLLAQFTHKRQHLIASHIRNQPLQNSTPQLPSIAKPVENHAHHAACKTCTAENKTGVPAAADKALARKATGRTQRNKRDPRREEERERKRAEEEQERRAAHRGRPVMGEHDQGERRASRTARPPRTRPHTRTLCTPMEG